MGCNHIILSVVCLTHIKRSVSTYVLLIRKTILLRKCLISLRHLICSIEFDVFVIKDQEETIEDNIERSKSDDCLKELKNVNSFNSVDISEDSAPPPIPPLPMNYQRSDGLLTIKIL